MYPNVTGIAYNGVTDRHVVGDRMDKDDITVSEAANRIGVSVSTLARAARLQQLEAKKLGTNWITTEAKALAWKTAFYNPKMKRK